jgi:hypothetical protein
MPRWVVNGVNPQGVPVRGLLNAPSERDARRMAKARGVRVKSVELETKVTAVAALNAISAGDDTSQPDAMPSAIVPTQVAVTQSPPQHLMPQLITCPACGGPVSAMAAGCPRCGHPIRRVTPPAAPHARQGLWPPHVQTIERTSKGWKLQMLLSSMLAIAGVIIWCGGAQLPGGQSIAPIGILALFGGLAWFMTARIGAWWDHG